MLLYSFTTDISGKYSLTYLTNMSTSQKEEPSLLIEFESEDTEKVDSKIDQNIILKSVDTELG